MLDLFREATTQGLELENKWNELFISYAEKYPDDAAELKRRLAGDLASDWEEKIPKFSTDPKGMATRAASGKVINALSSVIPELIGGSADLAPSNKTWLDGSLDFQADQYQGRNFHFGVREHGMGAVINGMAIHGGVIPYGATFLVFSDYMRGAIRVSALSHFPSIWVFTHDSIGVGEDGPTHQPVEHLAALRAIPNLVVLRPGDANEVAQAWAYAIRHREGPTVLALSRQSMPVLDRSLYSPAEGLKRGAYVLADIGDHEPELILMASGSEVDLIIKAGERLAAEGKNVRLISFPSWELFRKQEKSYQELVLIPKIKARLAIEAGVAQGWREWVGDKGKILSIDGFGASAPAGRIYEEFGLSVGEVIRKSEELLRKVG